ncbi:class D sortase [Heyndrickxia oleronia]|uniref:Class D sortase n=1 Tax=Heyndrickxia oleronia TaxID=38875 RepID=A0AAW6T2J9_9BACI|nr:class D sortase [Heyndrickxia oleronia]MDH5164025.1 class D sortase [Heyndrickxia oleronia]
MRTKKILLFIFSCIFILCGIWIMSMNGYRLFYFQHPNNEHITTLEPKTENSRKLYQKAPKKGDIIGKLVIPKINADLPIYEGAEDEELDKGVGHFSKSVLPGEKDNSVLSGHRDTVFRKLGEMKEDDELIVKTSAGQFTYKIKKIKIVDADDRTVIVPKPRGTLTVTTCYPFNYIGDAPNRFILVADLVR